MPATPSIPYTKGLHDLGLGVFAYLQPPGNFGFCNAGLIAGDQRSVVVDTLFDMPHAEEMLAAMAAITDEKPIAAAINTHGDGDHWFGNAALPEDARIHAPRRALKTMHELSPQAFGAMLDADVSQDLRDFMGRMFAPYRWDGPTRYPTDVFDDVAQIDVDGRILELVEVEPAHSDGDCFVHVPDASVVFTGDLVYGRQFLTSKISVVNHIAALDRVLEVDATTIVSGHGEITDNDGVRAARHYLEYVLEESRRCFDAGLDTDEATRAIDLSEWDGWSGASRLVVNVVSAYRDLDPTREPVDEFELYGKMVAFLRHRGEW
jgi:glyoxylase-like metal-dependent hydrolase (beta-lactamase superfamily II)